MQTHHFAGSKRGGVAPMPAKYTDEQRLAAFWSKVDPCRTDGCALWLGSLNESGYGWFWNGERMILSHCFLVGLAPKGFEWDHVRARGCTHRNCIWPEHLELVTHAENIRRGYSLASGHAKKTHCPKGHPYDEVNTYLYRGGRLCRACSKDRSLERTAARRRLTAVAS